MATAEDERSGPVEALEEVESVPRAEAGRERQADEQAGEGETRTRSR